MQQHPRALHILSGHLHRRLVMRLRGLLELADLGLGPAARHLVACAFRDSRQRVRRFDPLERRHGGIGMLRLQRDVQHLGRVGQAGERAQSGLRVRGVAADQSERLALVDEIDHGGANSGIAVLARDDHDFAHATQRGQVAHRVGGADLVGFGGQAGQAADGLGPDLVVRIGAGDVRQHGQIVNPVHRRTPDTSVGVLRRQGAEGVGVIRAKIVDGRRADGRIGVLPPWLGAKFLENTHEASVGCGSAADTRRRVPLQRARRMAQTH